MVVYIELCLPHLIEVALTSGTDDLFLLAEDALQRVLIIHEHVARR